MNNNPDRTKEISPLRQSAEQIAREREARMSETFESLSPEEMARTLHELRVHQIQLEMQNEELRQMQSELDTKRTRYVDLYELAPVGYVTVNEKGIITEANLTAANMLGSAKSALCSQPLTRFIHRDDQDEFYLQRKALLTTGEPQECDLRMTVGDGKEFWAHLTGTCDRNESGITACRIALTDITGRKKAEEELCELNATLERKVEERTAELSDARNAALKLRDTLAEAQKIAHVGSFEYIAATRQTVWSEEEYRIYGLDPAGPSPEYDVMLALSIHPDDADLLHRTFTTALQTHTIYELEHRIVRPDGSVRWVYDKAQPYFDEQGNLVRYIGTTLDVTERKAAEEQQKDSKKRLSLATDGADLGIWYWDVVANSLEWSERCKAHLCLPPGREPSFEHFYSVIHPDDRERVEGLIGQAVENRSDYAAEYRVIRPDGSERWLSAPGRVYCAADGALLGMGGVIFDITEHKEALENVRAGEERLRLALDAARMGSFHWQVATGEIVWSDSYRTIYGLPPDSPASYDNWLASLLPEDRADADRQVRSAMEHRGMFRSVHRIPWQDGTVHWIEGQGRFFYSTDGSPQRMEGVVSDITERKLTQDLLAANEQRYRSLFEHMLNGFALCRMLYDEQGKAVDFIYLEVNEAFARLTGLEEVVGKRVTEVIPGIKEQTPELFETYARVAATGIPEQFEINFTPLAIWLSVSVYSMEKGQFIAVIENITERKTAEAVLRDLNVTLEDLLEERTSELRSSEEKFRSLVETTSDCIWELDAQGRFTYLSPKFRDVTGYDTAEFLGRTPRDLMPVEEAEQYSKELQALLVSRQPFSALQQTNIRRDGTPHIVEVSGVPVFDASGEYRGVRGISRDITVRKQGEEELRRLNRSLKALSDCNLALSQAAGELELVNEICRIVVETGGRRMAWVGYAEQDAAKTVRPIAQAGFEEGYLDTVNITWADSERGREPAGIAIRTGKPCLCADILTDPDFSPWRAEATRRGYRSVLAMPLISEGQVLGVLTLYADTTNAFNDMQIDLLSQLASNIVLGIMVARTRLARAEAEEHLKETLTRLELATDAANIGVWSWNFSDDRLEWDERLSDWYGMPEELRHKGLDYQFWRSRVHPDDVELAESLLLEARRHNACYNHEFRIVLPDGSLRYIHSRSITHFDQDGTPLRMIGINLDITGSRQYEIELEGARNRAEAALALTTIAKERFQAIFEESPLGIALIDSFTGHIYEVNSRFAAIAGRSREEMATIDWMSITHPDDVQEDLDNMARLNAGEIRGFQMDKRYIKPDGSYVWISMTIAPVTVERGESPRHLCMIDDITQSKLYESEIRRFQDIVQSTDDAIIGKTLDGIVTSWNPAAEKMFGYGAAEMIGKPIALLFSPEQSAEERLILAKIAGGESVHHYVTQRIRKDGSVLDVSVTISPILDAEGRIVGASKIVRDITELIERERELEEARQAADAANQAKSEFISNMSHEIRTPMNGVIGITQLMEYTTLDEEQQEYLDVIKSSSNNLLRLINDILDLSKIESGKIELEHHEFSLRATIADVVNTQISLVHRKRLQLTTDIPRDVPDSLVGDQFRLKQIILNFLSNAIKFTEAGSIAISVALLDQVDTIATIRIGVTDSGIGISPEAIGKIFDPFSQADSSTTRRFGGTGLGLTICRQLAELMGGRVWVESTEGVGSTFYVVIPYLVKSILPEPHDRRKSDAAALVWDGKPLRILVADDNDMNIMVATSILKKSGMMAYVARDGQKAVEIWEQEPLDLILMDIKMPVMDGIEATEVIRAKEAGTGRHTPIIALTANALRTEQEEILRRGFDGYVTKPVEVRVLFDEIRRCLAGNNEDDHHEH